MLVPAYRTVSGTGFQGTLRLVFLLSLFRLALSTTLLASAYQILPSSSQMLPKSSATLLNDSISGLNETISSPFVLGPAPNTNSTTVSNDKCGWPEVPFNLPMWDIMGGKLLFTRIQRRVTGRQKEILRQIIGNKLNEWADRPGLSIPSYNLLMLCHLELSHTFQY